MYSARSAYVRFSILFCGITKVVYHQNKENQNLSALIFFLAPPARFELATNRLHVFLVFPRAWTISSPFLSILDRKSGAEGASHKSLLQDLQYSVRIVSEPYVLCTSWLLIAHTMMCLGFQQFTFFVNRDYARKLPFDSRLLYR